MTQPVGDILAELRQRLREAKPEVKTLDEVRYERIAGSQEDEPVCHVHGVQHPRSPSCPRCGTHKYATRESIRRADGTIVDVGWMCCYCNSVFAGTTDEWQDEFNRQNREVFKQQKEKFLTLYHERYKPVVEQEA